MRYSWIKVVEDQEGFFFLFMFFFMSSFCLLITRMRWYTYAFFPLALGLEDLA